MVKNKHLEHSAVLRMHKRDQAEVHLLAKGGTIEHKLYAYQLNEINIHFIESNLITLHIKSETEY